MWAYGKQIRMAAFVNDRSRSNITSYRSEKTSEEFIRNSE